jgi:hypothetical protein
VVFPLASHFLTCTFMSRLGSKAVVIDVAEIVVSLDFLRFN